MKKLLAHRTERKFSNSVFSLWQNIIFAQNTSNPLRQSKPISARSGSPQLQHSQFRAHSWAVPWLLSALCPVIPSDSPGAAALLWPCHCARGQSKHYHADRLWGRRSQPWLVHRTTTAGFRDDPWTGLSDPGKVACLVWRLLALMKNGMA